jgi:peptidoglycan/xylan/chitin deacetylase (PgdA/CDA1 family)
VHATLKRAVESALLHCGPATIGRRRHGGRTLVLGYHNIVERPLAFGDRSLHLPRLTFAEQLDHLVERCDVVPLVDLFAAPPRSDRPRVAITFDDAYEGALTLGAVELASRGLPATIFVAPYFIGGRDFWWDALAGAADGLAAGTRELALERLGGRDADVRAWAQQRHQVVLAAPQAARAASEDTLREALRQPGLTVGSHTWSHPNLARTDAATVERELRDSLAWLQIRFAGRVAPWISYPYGLYSAEVETIARRLGFAGGLAITGGWVPATPTGAPPPFTLPRLNVPAGLSREGFALRLAGLLC